MKGLNGVKYLLLAALLIFITVGCSSGGDDGIDGTGGKPEVPLAGTAAIGKPLKNDKVVATREAPVIDQAPISPVPVTTENTNWRQRVSTHLM